MRDLQLAVVIGAQLLRLEYRSVFRMIIFTFPVPGQGKFFYCLGGFFMEKLFSQIRQAFLEYEEEELYDSLHLALERGADPLEIVSQLSGVLEQVGMEFSQGTLFLPDMVMAGNQMEQCMEILTPALGANQTQVQKLAKVVLGTVAGDVHDIGKNMVKTMLSVSGFDVVDLGTDVSAAQFYAAAVSEKPAIVALSSCMTTTIPSMIDTIGLLKSKGLLDQLHIVVGGGSMNPALAEQLGTCTYGGKNAYEAVHIFKNLIG